MASTFSTADSALALINAPAVRSTLLEAHTTLDNLPSPGGQGVPQPSLHRGIDVLEFLHCFHRIHNNDYKHEWTTLSSPHMLAVLQRPLTRLPNHALTNSRSR